jgi:phosphoserine phosphatase RsbU/P
MRILVGWDDAAQAELISLYLDVDDNEVVIATDSDDLLEKARARQAYDVILLSTNLPDADGSFELFHQLRKTQLDTPIVGGCHSQDVFRIARFMTSGMVSYVIRDSGGDFVFLLQATLQSAVEAVRAERERRVAEKLREEVESVRKLQESVIPKDLYCPEGYRISARYEPSQIQVVGGRSVALAGGDYYDVFTLDDNNVVLLVGDASGHGMKAAMSIMTMHTLVRMIRSQKYRDTAAFVAEVNNQLTQQSVVNDEGGFITLLYCILYVDREELMWTSAGHPVPMIQNLKSGEVSLLGPEDAGGLPLGIVPEIDYETYTSPIPKGSRLLLFTDGLIEAFPEKGEDHREFGLDGVRETMKRGRDLPVDAALQSLFDESNAFTQGSGRHDDTSAILLERES